ncbi:MAG: type IV secretory system conjugative DNA transfer family protein [Oligoflexia bacterium]|nr:type IV secretory system conjugative DNA transfer family protein [Oligoflexia bacterium]
MLTIQGLEKLAVSYGQEYLRLAPEWSILTFGFVGALLMVIQWHKRRETYWYGIIGIVLLWITALHYFRAEDTIFRLDDFEHVLNEQGGVAPMPLGLEPIFSTFVGPASTRFVHQETLLLFFLLYLGSISAASWQNFRKTKRILGDISVSSLLAPGHPRPKRSKQNELGSGDLASAEQISHWTKPSGTGLDTVFAVSDLRGSQGAFQKNGNLYIRTEDRNKHMLAIAKTGGGKTSQLILPILYSDCLCPVRSTIVIDSKPEMWSKLAGLTHKYNPQKNIMLFNPLDRMRSLSWNILGKITDDTDCKLIAQTLIAATDQPTAKSDSPFFRNNALAILNSIMVGLLHDPSEKLSMPRVHELVQSGMKPLCDWLEAHPHALRNTRTFIELARSGSQNADTIMSELSMRLSAWDLNAIRATTFFDELDLAQIVDKPSLFIVEFKESELEMLRPMANVIVVELLRYLTKRAEKEPKVKLPRPVSLVIDEFASSLGRLPDIHVKLNTLRSRNISIVAAIQSIAQVKANYGDDADSVLAGFNTKILIPTLDVQDSEWASKESGQMTIRFQTASTGSNKKLVEWFASKNDSVQEQVQQRAVLTPDEIGRPTDNISTFFLPGSPVFQGRLVPFYLVPEIKRRIEESEKTNFNLRSSPIQYEEKMPVAGPAQSSAAPGGLPPGISNTKGWTDQQIQDKLTEVKKTLDWDNTTGSARKWWEAFENENKHRTALVLRLAEELQTRKATITEFFLAYVYSNTDNIQANLCYLDYTRLKKEEEKRKKEAAAKAKAAAPGGSEAPPPAPGTSTQAAA